MGEWLFTEWFGGNPEADTSGNGHDGIGLPQPSPLHGFAPPQPTADRYGESGQARFFNGSNQYVRVPKESVDLFPMADFANGFGLSLWFQAPEGLIDGHTLVSKTDNQSGFEVRHYEARTIQELRFYSAGSPILAIPETNFQAGEWNHLVFTWDPESSDIEGWVNGERVTQSQSDGFSNGNSLFLVGRGWETGYFYGSLDDVRVYNRPLSSLDISGLYQE